jgi:hypothetical protein
MGLLLLVGAVEMAEGNLLALFLALEVTLAESGEIGDALG